MRTNVEGSVYLIHFDTPIAHARHYRGWSENVEERIEQHRKGSGSKLMAEVRRRGITWRVADVTHGVTRHYERKLKERANAPRECPICKAEKAKEKS